MSYKLSFINYEFMFGQLGEGSFRDHSGINPGSFWDYSRVILGSFRDHSGVIPISFQAHSGVIPGSFQDHSGVIPGSHAGPPPARRAGRPCGGFRPLFPLEEPSSETLLGKNKC